MKYALLTFMALVLAPSAQCQNESAKDDQWFKSFENETAIFSAKRGSMEITHESGRKKSVLALFRLREKKDGGISFYKFKVSASDCNKEYGTIIATTLDDAFVTRYDFVKDGGNYASYIAQSLCEAMRASDAADNAAAEADAEAQGSL